MTRSIGRATRDAGGALDPQVAFVQPRSHSAIFVIAILLRASPLAFRGRLPGTVSFAFVTLVLVGALAGCRVQQPETVFDPTTVGVVESTEGIRNLEQAVTLLTGERIVIDFGGGKTANDVPGTPREGELLIYVEDVDGKPWVELLTGGGDCFQIQGRAIDTGESFIFESGLRLPLSPTYDPGWPGPLDEYTNDQARFCVNADGVVTEYAG